MFCCCSSQPPLEAPIVLKEGSPLLQGNARTYYAMFIVYALSFSFNHAAVTTTLSLSAALLGVHTAGVGNSLLYVFYGLSALLAAFGVVVKLGPARANALGLGVYCYYVGAYMVGELSSSDGLKTFCAVTGGILGGCAAGILWTAQGVFLTRVTRAYAAAEGLNAAEASGRMSGTFAGIYLMAELTLKLTQAIWSENNPSVGPTGRRRSC